MSVPEFLRNYNGTNGHTPADAGDNGFGQYSDIAFDDTKPAPRTPAVFTLWKQEQSKPSWQDREPPYLHSLKYHIDGIEHMTVIRATDVDSLWLEVRKVMALVKATRAKAQTEPQGVAVTATDPEPPQAAAEPQKGFCSIHNLWMTLHHAKDGSGGQWY